MFCLVNSWHLLGDVEKEALPETTSGPWEPREPGLFSSGYGKASEHAVISSFPVSAVGGISEPAVQRRSGTPIAKKCG